MFLPSRPNEDAAVILSNMDSEQRSDLVRKTVHAVVVLGQDRNPIKKQDLYKLVLAEISHRGAAAIVQQANKELIKLFDTDVNEDDIIENLEQLSTSETCIKNYLELFVKKMYLHLNRRQESRFYSWGPRASAEIDPDEFFKKFLIFIGEKSDSDWPELRKKIDDLKAIQAM